ncbi:glycosyl transferase family protein [Qipengyuania huizhouensis]|uniref:glycosyl transferase family protein n=1 Tax=Qipengyuania huizhouensis TaxID=2867245 RepID=UPI001C86DFA2|nr:glycosyl transferase family protein [Qipengyuania huizhouensis]MBX7460338.1 glycosyl transferase family protein [Qipengyuania huizhouensis]
MDSFVAVLQWTALVVAILIALSSLDDLFVDAVFWAMKLKRRIFGQSRPGAVAAELLVDKPEQPIAIMLPAWKEFDVIASMVESAVNTLAYRNYMIFIGTYANDAETIAEAEKVTRRYKQVRHVRVPHDGPTCKADCLNHIVSDILQVEEELGVPFAGLVLHDSEDVLHPLELHLFNYLLPAKDMIQLPVVSLEQRYRDLVAGTYMDEFAEWHAKDLVVRQRLAKTVPSAGVGTCFSRRAIKALMEDGDAFNTDTLTEDYDIGNRLAERDMGTIIALYPVEFRTRRGAFFGMGPERMVTFSMPLCVREHFPNTFKTSYRQKARWILGIALQGWSQLGWSGSAIANYFLFRDRKALLTPTLAILAYALVVIYLGLNIWSKSSGGDFIPLFSGHWIEFVVLWFNLFALIARILQRLFFVERIYGWGHAFMSVPRIFVLSLINFAASMRAMRIFIGSKFSGKSIAWDKTMHRFPTDEWLGTEKRRIGEILLSWEVVTPPAIEKALVDQKLNGGMLGDLLVCHGAIDEQTLVEAVATQANLPTATISLEMVRENLDLLDEEVMSRLHVLPFGRGQNGDVMLAVSRPLPPSEKEWMRTRLGRPFRQYIVPDSQITRFLGALVKQPHWDIPVFTLPRLHELLIEQKILKRRELRRALEGYDVARHGSIGNYLVANRTISQQTFDEMSALRHKLVEAKREEARKELVDA